MINDDQALLRGNKKCCVSATSAYNWSPCSLTAVQRASCGVMVGITSLEYSQLAQRAQRDFTPYSASGHLTLSVAAGRISYTFGLKGPSFPGEHQFS